MTTFTQKQRIKKHKSTHTNLHLMHEETKWVVKNLILFRLLYNLLCTIPTYLSTWSCYSRKVVLPLKIALLLCLCFLGFTARMGRYSPICCGWLLFLQHLGRWHTEKDNAEFRARSLLLETREQNNRACGVEVPRV